MVEKGGTFFDFSRFAGSLIVLMLFMIPSGHVEGACRTGSCKKEKRVTTLHSIENLKLTMDLGSTSRNQVPLHTLGRLLFARSDELESPLNNALSLVPAADVDRWERAQEILYKHLNKPETKLVLLENKDDGRGFQPERGEDIDANWVFSLEIPSLSDHIYWIVIPSRKAPGMTKTAGYVYGFN